MRRLGGHMSTKDGIRYPILSTRGMGLEIMQIMVGESVSWSPYKITKDARNEFLKMSYGLGVFVHLPYTINPCLSPVERLYKAQQAAYARYLETAHELGARAVVVHPGFKKELTEDSALKFLVFFMEKNKAPAGLKVLLETDAGSKNGSAIGSLEFIAAALKQLGLEDYGMVLDTEHLYARGIDMWDPLVMASVLKEYQPLINLVHLNAPDPQVVLGSHLDRHSISFQDYPRDSTGMVRKLVELFPCILERGSLVTIERDVAYINQLTPVETEV